MRAVSAMAWSCFALALARVPAYAAPTIDNSQAAADTLARAERALEGHPAQHKVYLLPDEPHEGVPSNIVYVLPASVSFAQTLTKIGEPDCSALGKYVEDVNQLSMAMAEVALSGTTQALVAMRALEAYESFINAHTADFVAAVSIKAQLNDIEYALAPLLANKSGYQSMIAQRDQSPVRRAIVDRIAQALASGDNAAADSISAGELAAYDAQTASYRALLDAVSQQSATLQAQRASIEADPSTLAAWDIQQQSDALLDAALKAQDDLHTYTEINMAEALDAVNAAKTTYNEFARTDAASGDGDFPVWDADIESLFVGPYAGISFVRGVLQDMHWTLNEGAIEVTPPFQYDIYARIGSQLISLGSLTPWTEGPLPGSTTIEISQPSDVSEQTSVVGTDDRQSFVEQRRVLQVAAPHVRMTLGIGAYCGVLRSQPSSREAAPSSDGLTSVVSYPTYTFTQGSPNLAFTRSARGDFETEVQGPALLARCAIDSDDYALSASLKLRAALTQAWNLEQDFGPELRLRLEKIGIHCEFPDAASLYDAALRVAAQQISSQAVSEAVSRLTPKKLDRQASGELQLCDATSSCRLNLKDPSVFKARCTTQLLGNKGCTRPHVEVWYTFQHGTTYQKPLQLTSEIKFTVY